ncbi:MAG: glycosyltransferase [Candidatus Levyibacteriota bacterium]|nr:MAG: glycosyltransferase [Candidatus Levybacteria bacterium]
MRIGIDVSQVAYEGTGVGEYIKNLVGELLRIDTKNEYILFFSSLRRKFSPPAGGFNFQSKPKNLEIKTYRFPPLFFDLFWNRLHILPIEWFIGDVDIFISSDWTQPPTRKAKKITILYDLIVYKHPEETDRKIIDVQKRCLSWVKKECDKIICISEATKKDASDILGIEKERLRVIYPGA